MPPLKLTPITPALYEYVESHALLAHPILDKVAEQTAKLPDAMMQIPRHQGGFMFLLAKLLGATKALDVGCYTGYSAIAVAAALPPGGKVTTFDVDPKTSAMAKSFFVDAGLTDKIELILGSAVVTMEPFVEEQGFNTFDLAFIDADKVHYDIYYEVCLKALRPGGLILVDNAFRDGEILAPAIKDLGTQAVDKLTRKIKTDQRVEATLLPIADGVIMVRKK